MKKTLSVLIMGGVVGLQIPHAMAAVAERLSCDEITAEITHLSALEEPTEEDTARLKDLRAQNRRSCQKSAGARLNNSRAANAVLAAKHVSEVADVATDVAVVDDAGDGVDSFLAKKQELCATLAESINAKKADANADAAELEKMQAQYNADCVTGDVAEEDAEPAPTPEEVAAKNAELRAKGLCPDESKPNKFGCCAGEKFKDLGNLQFACCNEKTDECLAPIEKN